VHESQCVIPGLRNVLPFSGIVGRSAPITNKEAQTLMTLWESDKDEYGDPIIPDGVDDITLAGLISKGYLSGRHAMGHTMTRPNTTLSLTEKAKMVIRNIVLHAEKSTFEKDAQGNVDYEAIYVSMHKPKVKTSWAKKIAQTLPEDGDEDKEDEIFNLIDIDLEWLERKLNALNKRALKLGLKPPPESTEWLPGKGQLKQVGYVVLGQTQVKDKDNLRVHIFNQVKVFGEPPVLAGWKFLARLYPAEDPNVPGNLIKAVPGVELPERYRTVPPDCEHCRKNLRRCSTYVVQNVETGEMRQVGSTCLKDFLGHKSPESYARYAEGLAALLEEIGAKEEEGFGGGGGGGDRGYSIQPFVELVWAMVRKYGFLGRGKAYESGQTSTVDAVLSMIYGKGEADKRALKELRESITAEDRANAEQAIIWARGLKEGDDEYISQLSDYFWNLSVACSSEVVTGKTVGIVGSLPTAYERNVLQQIGVRPEGRAGEKGEVIAVKGKVREELPQYDEANDFYDILTEQGTIVRCALPMETSVGEDVALEGTVVGYARQFQNIVTLLANIKVLNSEEVAARTQEIQQEREQAQQGDAPEYSTGEKITTDVTVLKADEREGNYGPYVLYQMVDPWGTKLTIFYSGSTFDLETGERANISAKVKKVGDYNGEPSVVLTNPKINSRLMSEDVTDVRMTNAQRREAKKQVKTLESQKQGLMAGFETPDQVQQTVYNALNPIYSVFTGVRADNFLTTGVGNPGDYGLEAEYNYQLGGYAAVPSARMAMFLNPDALPEIYDRALQAIQEATQKNEQRQQDQPDDDYNNRALRSQQEMLQVLPQVKDSIISETQTAIAQSLPAVQEFLRNIPQREEIDRQIEEIQKRISEADQQKKQYGPLPEPEKKTRRKKMPMARSFSWFRKISCRL